MFSNKKKDIEIENLKEIIFELEKKNNEKEAFFNEVEKMIEHIENGIYKK